MKMTALIGGAILVAVWCASSQLAQAGPTTSAPNESKPPYDETLIAEDIEIPLVPEMPRRPNDSVVLKRVAIQFVYVPPGEMEVGAAGDARGKNFALARTSRVRVPGFWMSRHEVTNDAFVLFEPYQRTSDHRRIRHGIGPISERMKAADKVRKPGHQVGAHETRVREGEQSRLPVRGVTQFCAQQFCVWLSVRTGRTYRLPTEIEWEYAARAGTDSRFFFGDDDAMLREYAYVRRREVSHTAPREVGGLKPNRFGLYDVYGNVAEWTLEGWGEVPAPLDESPSGWRRRTGTWRPGLVRGGSFASHPDEVGSGARSPRVDTGNEDGDIGWYDLSPQGATIGFRLVRPSVPDDDDRASYLRINSWDHPR